MIEKSANGNFSENRNNEYGFRTSVTGRCETWWFDGRKKDAHTTRVRFSNARVKPDLPVENITYPLVEGRTITYCTGVGKS